MSYFELGVLKWAIRFLIPFIVLYLASCESAVQTAIRENKPPAIAYIVAPEQNNVRYIAIPEP